MSIERYAVIETALCIGGNLHDGEVMMVLADEHDRELASERLRADTAPDDANDAERELAALREELATYRTQRQEWADRAIELDKRLTAAEQRNATLSKLLQRCIPVCRYKGSHTERQLINEIEEVCAKPTESGASE